MILLSGCSAKINKGPRSISDFVTSKSNKVSSWWDSVFSMSSKIIITISLCESMSNRIIWIMLIHLSKLSGIITAVIKTSLCRRIMKDRHKKSEVKLPHINVRLIYAKTRCKYIKLARFISTYLLLISHWYVSKRSSQHPREKRIHNACMFEFPSSQLRILSSNCVTWACEREREERASGSLGAKLTGVCHRTAKHTLLVHVVRETKFLVGLLPPRVNSALRS